MLYVLEQAPRQTIVTGTALGWLPLPGGAGTAGTCLRRAVNWASGELITAGRDPGIRDSSVR